MINSSADDGLQLNQHSSRKTGIRHYLAIVVICLITVPFAPFGVSFIPIIALLITLMMIFAAESRHRAVINSSIVWAVLFFLLCMISPYISKAGEAAWRAQCRNNLKQIEIALYNYRDDHGTLPPGFTSSGNGKPTHSWRVLLLPYIDQRDLFDQYDLSEPWNGPNNIRLAEKRPEIYTCSHGHIPFSSSANYLALLDTDASLKLGETEKNGDRTDKTIWLVENTESEIQWTEPRDLQNSDVNLKTLQGLSGPHQLNIGWFHRTSGAHVLYSERTVDFLTVPVTMNRAKVIWAVILSATELFFIISCLVMLHRPAPSQRLQPKMDHDPA
jgi:hypothetical protein